jgi:U3 small nucleolar RNA-associated protein 20
MPSDIRPAKQLATVASQFMTIPLGSHMHGALLHFSTSILTAGDMSLWMSAGRRIVERSWEDLAFGIRLCGALSYLNWGGWKLLELPHVQKRVPGLLESHTMQTLDLLAMLHRKQRLVEVDQIFWQRLDVWTKDRLAGWALNGNNVRAGAFRLSFSIIITGL